MSRDDILDYVQQGRLAPQHVRRAMALAGLLPDAAAWRSFVDRLLLWIGTTMLGAALVFFLAYNWQDLGRYPKFAIAEGAIAASLVALWRLGTDSLAGKAALLAGSIFVGALLALIGQTYQTGADTFELFASWAVAILPWVLLGRLAALWVFWLVLVNLAVMLYFDAFPGMFGILFGTEHQLWMLFGLNTVALVALEWLRHRGVSWLQGRWSMQLGGTASGALITALAMMAILDWQWQPVSALALPVWIAWLTLVYFVYRRILLDLYLLAGGALSVIVVTASFLAKHLLEHGSTAASWLFIGVLVILMSAFAGWWLKEIGKETS
jgi:uncharacterized membrane protein